MDAYWYITRGNKRPKNRKLISAEFKNGYTILEYACEVDCDKLRECRLIYLGHGELKDLAIQKELLKAIKKVRW